MPIKPVSRRRFFTALVGGGALALLGGLVLKEIEPALVSQSTTQPLGIKHPYDMVWNRDLTRVAVTALGDASTMMLWDYGEQRIIDTFHSSVDAEPLNLGLAWSPDEQRVLQVTDASNQDNVICWDLGTRQTIYTANNQSISACQRVLWSPDGWYVAVVGDGTFVVLNAVNGHGLFAQKLNQAPRAIAWSPTNDHLTCLLGNTTSQKMTLLIWDAATNSLITHQPTNLPDDSFDVSAQRAPRSTTPGTC